MTMYYLMSCCCRMCLTFATKLKCALMCIVIFLILDFFGVFTHVFELSYDTNFVYPYEANVHEFVMALRHNEKPRVNPINEYNYSFVIDNKQKCIDPGYNSFRMVYVVKSAMQNFDRRIAIRNSWGFEKRFFDVPSRTVFVLGIHPNDEAQQIKVKQEANKYKDIIQGDFIDSYYNNTIKTMMGFKWLTRHCSNSKFYMFVDDDMYVSVKNVLRFVRNPTNYPDYLKEPKKFGAHKREIKISDFEELKNNFSSEVNTRTNIANDDEIKEMKLLKDQKIEHPVTVGNTKHSDVQNKNVSVFYRAKRQVFDFDLPEDIRLFAGFVFVSSPHRHKTSKWYVSLDEYPYHLWPPYVTAGAYILSKEALMDMYYTSLYTKHFKFDDIFLGIVAKKADIELFHCDEFHFYKKDYTKFNYKYVITSHGYDDPNELLYVWNEQKALGNA